MERKELSYLAVDLIEEALETPNKKIILEDRITRPICEPGIREPTEQELEETRKELMSTVAYMSMVPIYYEKVSNLFYAPGSEKSFIEYENKSKIILKEVE